MQARSIPHRIAKTNNSNLNKNADKINNCSI